MNVRIMTLLSGMVMVINTITGCQTADSKEPVTLTVNYPNAAAFYQRYGYAFERQHPGMKVEVLNIGTDSVTSGERVPDVVFTDTMMQYNNLIATNKLVELRQFMHDDEASMNKLSPIVIDLLSTKEDQLYGLSPSYMSQGIYYNMDLFKKYGIPFPTDQMSWKQVFETAERFPQETDNGERLDGFVTNYYRDIEFASFLRVGQTEGLRFIHPDKLKISINTDNWKTIFQEVVEAYRAGAIYNIAEEPSGAIKPDPFLSGNAAMQMFTQTAAFQLNNGAEYFHLPPVNWGVVTAPVQAGNPTYSDSYSVNEIFSLSSASKHQTEAWELVSFIVGDSSNMKLNMQANVETGIPAISDIKLNAAGHDISSLSSQMAAKLNVDPYNDVDYEIINAFKTVGQQIMKDVVEGRVSLEDGLRLTEQDGQKAVDAAAAQLEQKK